MNDHVELLRGVDVDHDLVDQCAGDALFQGHRPGVAVPDLGEVPAELAQRQLIGRRECLDCILQRVEILCDALLFLELGVPAFLEDFGHETIARFDLVVLRKGALGLVARLLQLPFERPALVAAISLQLRDSHQTRLDPLRRDHTDDELAQTPIDGRTPEARQYEPPVWKSPKHR